jgi:hypothetical protein
MSLSDRLSEYLRSLGPIACFVLCVVSALELLHQLTHLIFYGAVWHGDCDSSTKSFAIGFAVVEVVYYFFWAMVLGITLFVLTVKPKRVLPPVDPDKYI